jgi:hypothetical protein
MLGFGLNIPSWRTQRYFESRAVGRLPLDHSAWNPDTWWPHITNAAFRHRRPDDTLWAASKLAMISDEMIAAAVAEAQFGDAESEKALIAMISDRRRRILEAYLPAVNPVASLALDPEGRLHFTNMAVDANVALPPVGYRAEWSTFDNGTDTATPLASVEGATSPLPPVPLPPVAYVKVELSAAGGPAAWTRPVTAYFRRAGRTWLLVGLERIP